MLGTKQEVIGIGRATSLAFVRAGCRSLALLDKNTEGLLETRRQIQAVIAVNGVELASKINVQCYPLDVTSAESVDSVYKDVKEIFGRVDYSVQCAGAGLLTGPTVEASVEAFDLQNSITYRGSWLCSRAALTIMCSQTLDSEAYPSENLLAARSQRGAIVNVASSLALASQAASPAYCGSKAAILAITRSDAIDYASHQIRVNAVLPGAVDTPMINHNAETRAHAENHAFNRAPLKRIAFPEEIADTIVFLASNQASYITGASILVDGGEAAGS